MENRRSLFGAIPPAIIAGIIIGMIGYFGLNYMGYKEYTAQAKVVTSSVDNVGDNSKTATYAATINSPKIKQKTLETLGINWNAGKLDSKLDITPVDGSSIIDISVSDTNKLRAEDIADQYADYAVRVLNNIYNSGADIMEYSYGLAQETDNTLKYSIIAGSCGALLWMLLGMIGINSHNKKLIKANLAANNDKDIKEVREVKESKKTKERPAKKSYQETKATSRPVDTKEDVTTFEPGTTRVIDSREVRQKSSNKYEVLGKLPNYEKGELDV